MNDPCGFSLSLCYAIPVVHAQFIATLFRRVEENNTRIQKCTYFLPYIYMEYLTSEAFSISVVILLAMICLWK